MRKTIVLGKGFLGKKFEQRGFEVWGKDKFCIKQEDNQQIKKEQLSRLDNYNVIVNCIAKTDTRWCEKRENFNEALFSNGFVPGILSEYCKRENKKFVHISTGCLYYKKNIPQTEKDFIAAHCNYTVTKWVGEMGCNNQDLILRPRLFFGDFKDRNNLLCKLPKFKRFLTELNSYTSLDILVDAINVLLKENESGIFNVAGEGYATVMDLAEYIGFYGKE